MARELLKDLIYGEQLVSDGCEADFAIGLTYSLDLEAMLTVPLALRDFGELDSNVKQNPAYLLEGIRRSSDNIALFCNKGGIHVPQETRTVYSLLENSIFEVQNGNDIFSNFHPKLWLVKETDKQGAEWLKLSVMSRNLGFSTSLDICCSIRGRINKHKSEKGAHTHKPLKDMLLWVSEYAQSQKTKAENVRKVAGLLDYVDRFELEAPFQTEDVAQDKAEGYDFFPFVYGKEEFSFYAESVKESIPSERIMVISPFIDTATLSWLTEKKKNHNYGSKNSILITRKEFVTQQVFDLFEQVWVPNDSMLDNTTAKVDLHAKIYLTQNLSGDNKGYTLYLGSANATKTAFNRNAEFLLRLRYKQTTKDRIAEMLDEFVGEHRFVLMDSPNIEVSNERTSNEKECTLKRTVGCLRKALITPSANNASYNVNLTFKGIKGVLGEKIEIRPFQCKNLWKRIDNEVEFKDIPPFLLSEIYVMRIQNDDGSFMEIAVKAKTTGMPANRDETIYQSIVTNKEELLDYVAFMISDCPSEYFLHREMINKGNKRSGRSSTVEIAMPLYEQLLKTAYKNSEQIVEVQKFIKKMKQEIVPEELNRILDEFQKVSKLISKL